MSLKSAPTLQLPHKGVNKVFSHSRRCHPLRGQSRQSKKPATRSDTCLARPATAKTTKMHKPEFSFFCHISFTCSCSSRHLSLPSRRFNVIWRTKKTWLWSSRKWICHFLPSQNCLQLELVNKEIIDLFIVKEDFMFRDAQPFN